MKKHLRKSHHAILNFKQNGGRGQARPIPHRRAPTVCFWADGLSEQNMNRKCRPPNLTVLPSPLNLSHCRVQQVLEPVQDLVQRAERARQDASRPGEGQDVHSRDGELGRRGYCSASRWQDIIMCPQPLWQRSILMARRVMIHFSGNRNRIWSHSYANNPDQEINSLLRNRRTHIGVVIPFFHEIRVIKIRYLCNVIIAPLVMAQVQRVIQFSPSLSRKTFARRLGRTRTRRRSRRGSGTNWRSASTSGWRESSMM